MTNLLRPAAGVELSADVRMAGRVRRLAATSMVALGVVWSLATITLELPPLASTSLLAGWALMPAILLASLARPALRYALTVPASLVGLPLLAVMVLGLPIGPIATAGWAAVTAGVLLGGALGLWFWYRVLPVPSLVDDPFAPGRLLLIRIHVALILGGLLLVAVAPLLRAG